MKRFYLLVLFAVLIASCDKPVEYNQTLGLLSEYNVLKSDGGSTDVAVFSNTTWNVRFLSPASWASIDRLTGEGCGRVIFSYEQNFGRSRRVLLEFTAEDKVMILNMYQQAAVADDDVVMNFSEVSFSALSEGGQTELAFETNLMYDLDRMSLLTTYSDDSAQQEWVHLVGIEKDKVIVLLDANVTGAPRTAHIQVSHSDEGKLDSTNPNVLYSNILTITQQ